MHSAAFSSNLACPNTANTRPCAPIWSRVAPLQKSLATLATRSIPFTSFVIISAAKPNPQLTDDQWAGIKKDLIAQSHETLGVIASVDKKWDAAIAEFKTAVEGESTPEPATMLRLAATYNNAKQYDEATAMADKVLALPNVPDKFKKIAQDEKQRAAKLKASTK